MLRAGSSPQEAQFPGTLPRVPAPLEDLLAPPNACAQGWGLQTLVGWQGQAWGLVLTRVPSPSMCPWDCPGAKAMPPALPSPTGTLAGDDPYLKLRWRPWFGVIFTGWLVVPMM